MDMIEKGIDNTKVDTKALRFVIKSITPDHVGGYGEIKEIREESLAVFSLDALIDQLINARNLLYPEWNREYDEDDDDDDDYSMGFREFFVHFWGNRPALVCEMDDRHSTTMKNGYVIAPVINRNLRPLVVDVSSVPQNCEERKPEGVESDEV